MLEKTENLESTNLVNTNVITSPVPCDYTEASLEFLQALANLESDEALRLNLIILILQRKW